MLILLVLVVVTNTFAQNIQFKDSVIKFELIENNYNLDADRDNEISIEEAESVTTLLLYAGTWGRSVPAVLNEMHYFKNLEKFTCQGYVSAIDLHDNKLLKDLEISWSELASLCVTENVLLERLVVTNATQIEYVDLSKNTLLPITYGNNVLLGAKLVKVNSTQYSLYNKYSENNYWGVPKSTLCKSNCEVESTTDEIVFFDGNLKSALFSYSPTIDLDSNGRISKAEANKVFTLDISNKGICNLEGLQYFKYLNELYCDSNKIESIDFIEELYRLRRIDCSHNRITADYQFILGSNGIEYVDCSHNLIERLIIKSIYELDTLNCSFNDMISLEIGDDYEYFRNLQYGRYGGYLKDNYGASVEYLNCSNNKFTELGFSTCNYISFLDGSNNELLRTLDISNVYIHSVNFDRNDNNGLNVCALDLFYNNPDFVYPNSTWIQRDCGNNHLNFQDDSLRKILTPLYDKNNDGVLVYAEVECDFWNSDPSSLDLSGRGIENIEGLQYVCADTIDLSGNFIVNGSFNAPIYDVIDYNGEYMTEPGNLVNSLAVSLDISNNKLTSFDLSKGFEGVQNLNIADNLLTSLTFSSTYKSEGEDVYGTNYGLKTLEASGNDLNCFDVSYVKYLTSVNVSSNSNLLKVQVSSDQLSDKVNAWTKDPITDWSIEECGVLTNVDEYKTISVPAYPNPASEMLNFSSKIVGLFSLAGVQVKGAFSEKSMNVSNVSPGIYVIKYTNGAFEKVIIK